MVRSRIVNRESRRPGSSECNDLTVQRITHAAASAQSPIRCFNSQTRSAANNSALVRVRLPGAANSGSPFCSSNAWVFRGRPRPCFRRAFALRPRPPGVWPMKTSALLFIKSCSPG
jgi:hypothetical protein